MFLAAFLLFVLTPSVTVYYRAPLFADGYHSWVFPVSVAILAGVYALWRTWRRPGIISLLVSIPVSFFIFLPGAWIS